MRERLARETVTEMHRAEARWLNQARDRLSRAPEWPGANEGEPDEESGR